MKREEKRGWKPVWAAIGLIAVSCLLMYAAFSRETLGLSGPLYYGLLAALSVAEVALVYLVARKFLGKRK